MATLSTHLKSVDVVMMLLLQVNAAVAACCSTLPMAMPMPMMNVPKYKV